MCAGRLPLAVAQPPVGEASSPGCDALAQREGPPHGSREPGLEMGLNQELRYIRWIHSRHSNQGPTVARMKIQHGLFPVLLFQFPFPERLCLLSLGWVLCLSSVRGPWGSGPVPSDQQQQARTKSSKGKQAAIRKKVHRIWGHGNQGEHTWQ